MGLRLDFQPFHHQLTAGMESHVKNSAIQDTEPSPLKHKDKPPYDLKHSININISQSELIKFLVQEVFLTPKKTKI